MIRILKYLWFHFVMLATSWLPDFTVICYLRGFLLRPAFRRCGGRLQVARNVVINHSSQVTIGREVFIGYSTWIHAPRGLTIEDEVQLAPFVVIITGDHGKLNLSYRWGHAGGAPISIGAGSWIAAHAILTAGARIGRGCLVAAGAVVRDEVPDHCVAGGVPARVLREDVGDNDPTSPNLGVRPSQLASRPEA